MEVMQTKARTRGGGFRANSKIIGSGNFTTSIAPADLLLSRLEGVQQRGAHPKGPRSWVARCPSHDDRHPSLSVREFPDGSLSVYCFSHRCETPSILSAVGLRSSDLFPRDLSDDYERHHEQRRLGWFRKAALVVDIRSHVYQQSPCVPYFKQWYRWRIWYTWQEWCR